MNVHFDAKKHEYTDDDGRVYPSVTQILKSAGMMNIYKVVAEDRRKALMDRGTSVHWLLELEDLGTLNRRRIPVALRGYFRAYRNWKKASGFRVSQVEVKFISRFGYAGMIDRIGTLPIPGRPGSFSDCVLDLKTGASPAYVNLQLVAYGQHYFNRPVRRIALVLREDGTHNVKEIPLSSFAIDWATFYQHLRKFKEN